MLMQLPSKVFAYSKLLCTTVSSVAVSAKFVRQSQRVRGPKSKMQPTAKVKGVIIDLSGTVHIENEEVPGAIEAIKRLRTTDLKIKFVTNTSKESKQYLYNRLQHIGFDIRHEEIFTCLTGARELVQERGLRPLLFLAKEAEEDFHGVATDSPNAVVVGLAPDMFTYSHMNQAFQLLLTQPQAPLIAMNKARYIKKPDGFTLAAGPFVEALEFATGRNAELVGKPNPTFFLESIRSLGCQPAETVMIGDDERDDVKGALDVGMYGILVKTGKYLEGDELKIPPPGATAVCRDLGEAVDYILSNLT